MCVPSLTLRFTGAARRRSKERSQVDARRPVQPLVGRVAPRLRLRLVRRCRGRPRADSLPQRNDFAKVICVMHRHTGQLVGQCQARL